MTLRREIFKRGNNCGLKLGCRDSPLPRANQNAQRCIKHTRKVATGPLLLFLSHSLVNIARGIKIPQSVLTVSSARAKQLSVHRMRLQREGEFSILTWSTALASGLCARLHAEKGYCFACFCMCKYASLRPDGFFPATNPHLSSTRASSPPASPNVPGFLRLRAYQRSGLLTGMVPPTHV